MTFGKVLEQALGGDDPAEELHKFLRRVTQVHETLSEECYGRARRLRSLVTDMRSVLESAPSDDDFVRVCNRLLDIIEEEQFSLQETALSFDGRGYRDIKTDIADMVAALRSGDASVLDREVELRSLS